MRKLLLLGAGGAIGYVLGAKAGTARYESLKAKATSVKERSPELVHRAREIRGKSEGALEEFSSKVADVRDSASTKSSTPTDSASSAKKSVTHSAN